MQLTTNRHRVRHIALLDALDELMRDYLLHHEAPTEPPAGEPHHNGISFDGDDETRESSAPAPQADASDDAATE